MLFVPRIGERGVANAFERWQAGAKNVGRAFPLDCAAEANVYARRVGAGAAIYEMPSGVLIAEIVRKSTHRAQGVVTEVTWAGGAYL